MRSSKVCSVGCGSRPFLYTPLSFPASPPGLGFRLLAHTCSPLTHCILFRQALWRMVSLASFRFTLALDSELRPCATELGPAFNSKACSAPCPGSFPSPWGTADGGWWGRRGGKVLPDREATFFSARSLSGDVDLALHSSPFPPSWSFSLSS